MDPISFFFISYKSVFISFTKVIIFITFANQSYSMDDQKFQACAPISCGKGPNISYPFRLSHQEPFCGYPNFEISCNHDYYPILRISNDDYVIKDIFYNNQSFIVASASVYEEEDFCPTTTHNFTLDRTPFNISPGYINFSFLYNCTSKPREFPTYPIICDTNTSLYSFAGFHIEALDSDFNYSLKSCHRFVNAPLHTTKDIDSLLKDNYTEVLKMGFLLNWTAHNCSTCERSGGRCGFQDNEFLCFCHDRPNSDSCDDDNSNSSASNVHGSAPTVKVKVIIGIVLGVIGILITCGILYCFKKIPSVTATVSLWELEKRNQDVETFLKNHGHHGPLAVKRYNFSEVKKMTNFFKDKLGQGGYGSVYKGKLFDGRFVAVKVLNASKGEGEEFINEVASISRTSHVNIVTLWGFCLEGQNKALIYEFMPNGSLEKFVCSQSTLKTNQLEWEIMHQIAIGIARGLEYLHRGCNTRIVHFDIKPHNILLDENFCPKISDFGLAKLYTKKDSIISMLEARGTIEYIAPEVFCRNFGGVTYKSDVYSYGMMVIDMIGGREKDENGGAETGTSSEIYFPYWVYKRLELGNECELYGEISIEETEIVRKMTLVGLWCIQTNPLDRPSMSKVIEMLEGSSQALTIPPNPFQFYPPKSPLPCSFTTSTA